MMAGFQRHDLRLTANLFRMAIRDRYLGSALGSAWAIANPLFMLGLYTFVFGFVFKARLPGAESTLAYVIWLISGYGPWLASVESIMAASLSIVGAAGIVKNLAIRTELLPIAAALTGVVSLTVSLAFVTVLIWFDRGAPGLQVLWLPLIVAVQFALVAAIGLWLSAINVFFRDLSLALPNLLTIVMFSTPIFYPLETMPAALRGITAFNPFYLLSEAYRAVLVSGGPPSAWALLYVALLAVAVFVTGLTVFRRAKGHFGSML